MARFAEGARSLMSVALLFVWARTAKTEGGDSQGTGSEAGGRLIAQSDFLWDADGWEVRAHGSSEVGGLTHVSKMVKSADSGDQLWYFIAPPKFLGSQRAAYGGALTFRHGFFEYDSQGKDIIDGPMDVILVSEANDLMVGKRGVIPPYEFSSEHRLELHELAGWLLTPSNEMPSRLDMIRLLSKLSGIWIRGGFYAGHEDSYIMGVNLIAGPEEKGPVKTSLKQQHIVDLQQGEAATPEAPEDENKERGKKDGGMFGRILSGFGGHKEKGKEL